MSKKEDRYIAKCCYGKDGGCKTENRLKDYWKADAIGVKWKEWCDSWSEYMQVSGKE